MLLLLLLGVKTYNEALQAEVERSNRLKGGGQWSDTKAKTPAELAALKGGRYEARYCTGRGGRRTSARPSARESMA